MIILCNSKLMQSLAQLSYNPNVHVPVETCESHQFPVVVAREADMSRFGSRFLPGLGIQ